MTTSSRANLTYYAQAQANGYLTVNDIANKLEAFAQLMVLDRGLTAPPGGEVNGDCYLVKATATGEWAGQEGKIAIYYDGWVKNESNDFLAPIEGMRMYVADEDTLLVYDGSAWKGVAVAPLGTNCPRNFHGVLSVLNAIFSSTSDRAYFYYMGRTNEDLTPLHVSTAVASGAGSGTTSEVGVFSSPVAPNKSAQTLTKIEALTITGMNTSGIKRNSTPFSTPVPAGVHLWAGYWNTWSSSPGHVGVGFDLGQGNVLITSAAGALTSSASFAGTILGASASPVCPLLSLETD